MSVESYNAQYDAAVMSFQEQYTHQQVDEMDVVFPYRLGSSSEYWGLPKILVKALHMKGGFAHKCCNGAWKRVKIWFPVTRCRDTGYEQVPVPSAARDDRARRG